MSNSKRVLLTGTRDSELSLAQTRQNIRKIMEIVPDLEFEVVPTSSPGDRDRQTDLRLSDDDFFTRDLDEAVLTNRIDCAFHSAKDLPPVLQSELDMFYLPWREDPRDVLILRAGLNELPPCPVIGISSHRRQVYAEKRFPHGRIAGIRGNIDNRIKQLDAGNYDVLIMAAAGLNRLGLSDRISEYIDSDALPTPPGQGWIAVTYRKGNKFFNELRKLFVHRAIIAGAGVGSRLNATVGTVSALENCDVCIYDALAPQDLLGLLPEHAVTVNAGKRYGRHSTSQDEICAVMIDHIRQGKRVVRLKGGDPGLFGRLAEETAALDEFNLPYEVLPGISSLSAATSATGLLLTRREICRGFTVATPRKAESGKIEWFPPEERDNFTQVYFMAAREAAAVTANMLSAGYPADLPTAVVYNAGCADRTIITGTLADIADKLPDNSLPGIILAGRTADKSFLYANHGALAGVRILFCGSQALAERAEAAILDFGGTPIIMPMLDIQASGNIDFADIMSADWLIVPSPSCAQILLETWCKAAIDIRRLPKLAVCGPGTAGVFIDQGIIPEICPDTDSGSDGLIACLKQQLCRHDKVVRLHSDKAPEKLSEALRELTDNVIDLEFYANRRLSYDTLPDFDAVLFTSPSGVASFMENFPSDALSGKLACAIGKPTENELNKQAADAVIIKSPEAGIETMVLALAGKICGDKLKG